MLLAHAVNYELLLFLGQATATGKTNPAPIQKPAATAADYGDCYNSGPQQMSGRVGHTL
jgi:hypothetical protein